MKEDDATFHITHKWDRSSHEIPAIIPKFKWIPLNTSITFKYEQEQVRLQQLKDKETTIHSNNTSIGQKGHFYYAIEQREKLLKNKKLFISMTTISDRIYLVADVIKSILVGNLLPTHIYVFISSEPNLLDVGIPPNHVPLPLQYLVTTGLVSIVYTENIGPHRKLLPLLQKHWDDNDVLIVTFDDDKVQPKYSLHNIVRAYVNGHGKSIAALRVRRIGLCKRAMPANHIGNRLQWRDDPYGDCTWPRVDNGKREMLTLPTGNGGVLYHPSLLHPSIFDPELRRLTVQADDITFRLASLAMGVKVAIGCCTSGADLIKKCLPVRVVSDDELKNKHVQLFDKNQVMNTRMWSAGVNFMQKAGLLDTYKLYAENVMERGRECAFNKTMSEGYCGITKCPPVISVLPPIT